MSESTMLTVKTVLDDSGLRNLEKKVAISLEVADKLLAKFNNNAELMADVKPFVKALEQIGRHLGRLRKECEAIVLEPDADKLQEKLFDIQARLDELEKGYTVAMNMDPAGLAYLNSLCDSLEISAKKAAEAATLAAKFAFEQNVAVLKKEYEARQALAEQTELSEKDSGARLTAIKKEELEKRLKLYEAEAEAQLKKSGEAEAEIIQSIRNIKKELAELADTGIGIKEISATMDKLTGPMLTLANQLDALNQQRIKNRLDSLKKSHERELELLQEKLDAEMAMYDEQLEQYADLEKEKEDLTQDHTERMDELNSEMQDHLTEEEWLALQERMNEETLRYEESMAALEADTIARDEIQRQKELAEQEAMARKEKMEKEYAVRKAKLERKQAEATKKNNMFQAIVTTAAGIARAFADHMFPMSAAIAALVAAAGAVQIAAISAQPLPEIPSFRHGGVVGAANIHKYPQLPGPDNPHDKTLIWAQKGERVLNLQESGIFQKLLDGGLDLSDLYDNLRNQISQPGHIQMSMMEAQQARTSGNIDNSKHNNVAQNLTIQARNELTFAEARRLARKQNRALVRALA